MTAMTQPSDRARKDADDKSLDFALRSALAFAASRSAITSEQEKAILATFERETPGFAAGVEADITVEDHTEQNGGKRRSWHEVRDGGRYLCTCCEREDADRIAAAYYAKFPQARAILRGSGEAG